MWIDIAIKVIGFGIAMVICPPLTLAFVILSGLLPSMVERFWNHQPGIGISLVGFT